MLNEDYREMLQCLCDENVRFLLVGAYAIAVHGFPRATMDIDIWVMPSVENVPGVFRALARFGAPLHQLTTADLLKSDTLFQIGVAPRRIDFVTGAAGLDFESAYRNSVEVHLEGLTIRVPSLDDFIINKRAAGRTKDLAGVEALESLKRRG